jgi:UDP-glucose 4-epimerase
MRILITGGCGFIGRHLARALLTRHCSLTLLDLAPAPIDLTARPNLRIVAGSVLDRDLVAELIPGCDLVIHLAGIASPADYGADPLATMDVNLLGTIQVARLCAEAGVRILFSSTSEIYGVNPQLPWHERSGRMLGPIQNVRWCYATSKAAAEHYLAALAQKMGLDYSIVRFFNIYGPGLSGRVVDLFIQSALDKRPLTLIGDGQQTRCFCYVDDAIDAVIRLIDAPVGGGATYNIGTDQETEIIDLARLIVALTGSSAPLVSKVDSEIYPGYEDVPRRQPDISAIRRDFGWQPTTDLTSGLRAMIAMWPQQSLAS